MERYDFMASSHSELSNVIELSSLVPKAYFFNITNISNCSRI